MKITITCDEEADELVIQDSEGFVETLKDIDSVTQDTMKKFIKAFMDDKKRTPYQTDAVFNSDGSVAYGQFKIPEGGVLLEEENRKCNNM